MSNHPNIKKHLNKTLKSINDGECLFLYTQKTVLVEDWTNLLTNYNKKIFYISYAGQKDYLAIGRCREFNLDSKKELLTLKNLSYNIHSYGETVDKNLKIFGGVSFDMDGTSYKPWDDIPKGSFFIPEFLITKDNNECFISYFTLLNKNSDIEKINAHYTRSLEDFSTYLNTSCQNNLKFDEDVPNRADYSNIFNKFSNNIIDGTINKAILSRTKEFSIENKAILKNTHSPCTTFYIDLLDSKRFFGSTPEILISVNNKTYNSAAIAGTLKKEENKTSEVRLSEFLDDPKELLEHKYVVDDLTKKLDKRSDQINIAKKPKLLELDHLYHLHTPISGTLKDNSHILDLLYELYPTPAVLGYPKESALEVIREHEPFDRGWYGGCVGWFDLDGNGRFDVAIRSALQSNRKLYCYAGGGILEDSKEGQEWDEAELKFQHLLSLID